MVAISENFLSQNVQLCGFMLLGKHMKGQTMS